MGILMYEVLSREVPYADKWPITMTADPRIGLHVTRGNRPNLSLIQRGCPSDIVELMKFCWAGDPAKRPNFGDIVHRVHVQLELTEAHGLGKRRDVANASSAESESQAL